MASKARRSGRHQETQNEVSARESEAVAASESEVCLTQGAKREIGAEAKRIEKLLKDANVRDISARFSIAERAKAIYDKYRTAGIVHLCATLRKSDATVYAMIAVATKLSRLEIRAFMKSSKGRVTWTHLEVLSRKHVTPTLRKQLLRRIVEEALTVGEVNQALKEQRGDVSSDSEDGATDVDFDVVADGESESFQSADVRTTDEEKSAVEHGDEEDEPHAAKSRSRSASRRAGAVRVKDDEGPKPIRDVLRDVDAHIEKSRPSFSALSTTTAPGDVPAAVATLEAELVVVQEFEDLLSAWKQELESTKQLLTVKAATGGVASAEMSEAVQAQIEDLVRESKPPEQYVHAGLVGGSAAQSDDPPWN